MSNLERQLADAIELNRAVHPTEAYETVVAVINGATQAELLANEQQIRTAIASFLKKRRRALADLLAERLIAPELTEPDVRASTNPESVTDAEGLECSFFVPTSNPERVLSIEEPVTVESALGPEQVVESLDAPAVTDALSQISDLIKRVKMEAAEQLILDLIRETDRERLKKHQTDFRNVIELFMRKRKRAISEVLETKLSNQADDLITEVPLSVSFEDVGFVGSFEPNRQNATPQPTAPKPTARPPKPEAQFHSDYNRKRFNDDLNWLSRWHIFQWNTQYRDTLAEYFDTYFDELCDSGSREKQRAILDLIKSALSNHSREIFSKGYSFSVRNGTNDIQAVQKQLTGLRRFLDIPIEIYSTKLPGAHQNESVRPLRTLASSMLFGILTGFSWADLGQARDLHQYPAYWCYALPFLTYRDMQELAGHLYVGPGALTGIGDCALPLAEALDTFIEKQPTVAPLPALSEFGAAKSRLDVTLQLAPSMSTFRQLNVRCHLQDDRIELADFEEAAARQSCIVLANLSTELRAHIASNERLSDMVIATGTSPESDICGRIINALDDAIYEDRSSAGPTRPILSNLAREFPIENPFLAQYQHVYRKSVRDLMRTFERRKGVRLWCSVRRSGKTTACAKDLGSASEDSIYLAQSCSSTGQIDAGDVFYKAIVSAMNGSAHLDDNFVVRVLHDCVDQLPVADKRMIVVLDEYEILFGYLRESLRSRPEVRYTVVQPLLDQLVAFARDNLLVFMGQQPAAHFIMMDQNQLSPMVVQDAFPLFSHDPKSPLESSEFWLLLRKILRTSSDPDPEFINAVYDMTGGHPFLTVNLMVALLDWMIEESFPRQSLNPLSAETFEQFIREQLTQKFIAGRDHFTFFKRAAAYALSPDGRETGPWLYVVYTILRSIQLESPSTYSFTESEFETAVVQNFPNVDAHDLLGTAVQSNFLTRQNGLIRPRIQILSRIAGAISPGTWY